MTESSGAWRRRSDVGWIGDAIRIIAARTSPPDDDGPRILAGAAAWVWLSLNEPQTQSQLAANGGPPDLVEQALRSLADAGLIELV